MPDGSDAVKHPTSRLGCENGILFGTAVLCGSSVTALIKGVYASEFRLDGRSENFRRPLTISLLLFLAMSLGLPTELLLRRSRMKLGDPRQLMLLALPAICDICATILMNLGLLALSMSEVQLLRGIS